MSDTEQPVSKPLSVMVVDDSRVQLQFAVDLCRAQGWSVDDTASDGMEALLKLRKYGSDHPDLMLLDLEMPGLNGIDLLQELARLHLKMPILILSSRELSLLESVSSMAQQSGLNIIQVVQKPLRAEVLQGLRIFPAESVIQSPMVSQEEFLAGLNQLQTVYTPSVSIETGLIHHVTARLAWPHAQFGLLFPAVYAREWHTEIGFLHAMEQHQQHVFSQIQQWNACGLSLSVQHELPLHNIQTALHARSLLSQVQQYGITSSKLTFEIAINANNPALISNMGALNLLRIQNIGLAIRDCNLEFDWVKHIRHVPFSQLVLCSPLFEHRTQDPLLPTLCQHTISLAHQLNMSVHAEGLASVADWQFLHQQHCDSAQGPLIGPALSADDVMPWIKENLSPLRQLAAQCTGNLAHPV